MIDWASWHNQPLLTDLLVVAAWLYALLTGPWRPAAVPPEACSRRRAVSFYGGLILFYLSIGSPLERVGTEYLFSIHVLLQMVIIYPVAALILRGIPAELIDLVLGWRPWRPVWALLLRPVPAGLLFVVLLSGWYVPRIFGWSLAHPPGEELESALFFGVAFLFWWPLIGRSRLFPPLGYAGRMIYLFALEVALTGLFSYILMAEHPIYPIYEAAPRIIPGLTPDNDQNLGGVLLSGLSSLVLVGALGINFLQWAGTETTGRGKGKPGPR